jgi:DNA-directed RNA polymerase subunit L
MQSTTSWYRNLSVRQTKHIKACYAIHSLLQLKMKIDAVGSNAIQVQIDGEDYSVADILHKELLGVKHVRFAGVAPPHPLIKTLTIQVHTDGADANDLLNEAVNKAQERLSELYVIAKETFPATSRPSSATTEVSSAQS